MKSAAWLSIALVAAAAFVPAHAYDKKERIHEGVQLHDKKDYEGAMVVYRSVLQDYPHDPTAVYELALSWVSSNKQIPELIAFLEGELASDVPQHPGLSMILGHACDQIGDYAKGEAAIRRGLAAAPDVAMNHYNLGINLRLQKRGAEAVEPFIEALKRKPDYTSAWIALGVTLKEIERPERALFALARGAALEPQTARGRNAAGMLWPLLFARVEQKPPTDATKAPQNEVTISIPAVPEEPAAEPGEATDGEEKEAPPDARTIESLMTGMTAASRHIEEWKEKSDAAFFPYALDVLTKSFSELDVVANDPFWKVTLPWFVEVDKAGHTETLAYLLLDSAGDKDAAAWVRKNEEKVKAYRSWR